MNYAIFFENFFKKNICYKTYSNKSTDELQAKTSI